jgi:hypothetical protein
MVMASSKSIKQLHFEKKIDIANSLRMGDPRRTRQIIYNLLSNAFKFTAHNGSVRLEAHEDSANTEFVVIRISDTGTPHMCRACRAMAWLTCPMIHRNRHERGVYETDLPRTSPHASCARALRWPNLGECSRAR